MSEAKMLRAFLRLQGFFIAVVRPGFLIFNLTKNQGGYGMKTLHEFDYELWAIEDNGKKRYFARIKATGEETDVSLKVMRLLLAQEKQMRREYAKRQSVGTVLSLDSVSSGDDVDEAGWLQDTQQKIDADILWEETKNDFCKVLTDNQLSIFNECLIEGKSVIEYAAEHGVARRSVYNAIELIRKKAKKYFG